MIFSVVSIILSLSLSTVTEARKKQRPCTSLDRWDFHSARTDKVYPVRVGLSLTDPGQNFEPSIGRYKIRLEKNLVSHYKNPAIYFPAVGGLSSVWVNGSHIPLPIVDYAGVGPVIRMDKPLGDSNFVPIEVVINDSYSVYSGFWRSAPVLCEAEIATDRRFKDELWQQTQPLTVAVVCSVLATFLLIVHFTAEKRSKKYGLFAISLYLWVPFFIALSGVIRSLSYSVGTVILFPSRVAASFGLLLLFYCYREAKLKFRDHVFSWVSIALVIGTVYSAFQNNITWQIRCLALTLPVQTPVLIEILKASRRSKRNLTISIFALITFCGEVSDLSKLLGLAFWVQYPVPYLARITMPPTLMLSSIDFILAYIESLKRIRIEDFRQRVLGRIALRLTRREITEDTVMSLAKVGRRVFFATNSIVFKWDITSAPQSGRSNWTPPDLNSFLELKQVKRAVQFGTIQAAGSEFNGSSKQANGFHLVIPLPLNPEPDYLWILSGFKGRASLAQYDLNLVRQFVTSMSGALSAELERAKVRKSEQKFQTLVKNLDPNLFEFIQRNINDRPYTVDATCERGVIFFDQKAYTSYLEEIHPDQAALVLTYIKDWVARSALQYNGRVKGFYGDAFIVEIYPLSRESRVETILRTARTVWALAEGVVSLNRKLAKEGLSSVSFRFGAHFGLAANVELDLIERGTTTLIGDTVNLAQRIQSEASPGTIYVTQAIAEAAVQEFLFLPTGLDSVKGRLGLVSVFRLIGPKELDR